MPAIMPDNDVGGHFQIVLRICQSDTWQDIWRALAIDVESFSSLGIAENTADRDVWMICQQRQIVLITGNRNSEGPTSLEVTIQNLGTPSSLPVLTIGHPQSVISSPEYAERTAVKLMEYLLEIERLRGTGRLYLP